MTGSKHLLFVVGLGKPKKLKISVFINTMLSPLFRTLLSFTTSFRNAFDKMDHFLETMSYGGHNIDIYKNNIILLEVTVNGKNNFIIIIIMAVIFLKLN